MRLRAFPVLYAEDVESMAAFYVRLGFVEQVRLAGHDGEIGYIGLVRDGNPKHATAVLAAISATPAASEPPHVAAAAVPHGLDGAGLADAPELGGALVRSVCGSQAL